MSTLRIDVQHGGSVRVVYPDPYGQTYDSHLICSKNPKTVQRAALSGLRAFVEMHPDYSSLEFSAVYNFLNDYVSKATLGRWKSVRWNSKSYPD
jgi:hypothetical protein